MLMVEGDGDLEHDNDGEHVILGLGAPPRGLDCL